MPRLQPVHDSKMGLSYTDFAKNSLTRASVVNDSAKSATGEACRSAPQPVMAMPLSALTHETKDSCLDKAAPGTPVKRARSFRFISPWNGSQPRPRARRST
ncbi:hypothetical protein NDU88_008544 [Pleurodeles waltl]|uniref:Uncharacterized protein n=1 Tax=Pleurodeles waltl TaxID=8319 RepID=A0AAV7QS21_PLEWA|nr:hypothetical protein NDU88_008544 [Pleurodeles waltl]